jgi:hypothetical protein
MSQEIDLCEDSGDNGEWPNTASVPSLPLSRKRHWDKEESSNDDHPRTEKCHGGKTTTGSAEFIVDLELADEVEAVAPHKKQRGVMNGERSVKKGAAGKCAIIRKDKDVDSEDEQVADRRQSREGNAAAASHPMNSDSEQTSRDDGSVSTSKPSSKASGQQWRVTAWEDRLSELADFFNIHGHCNVPRNYSENFKLGKWVANQRSSYRLKVKGKASSMTLSRIQELESIGFEWDGSSTTSQKPSTSKPPSNAQYWEARLRELADYCKEHGHCNVPTSYSENVKLAKWVGNQRSNYKLHLEGKTSPMTNFRIQELESLGFEWGLCNTAWEDRLSELADYRKIHGHCNVTRRYNENTKLGKWVADQRVRYNLYVKGKRSPMTTIRIQELESLGFEWDCSGPAWEDRLSELADYRKIHGHCNVPRRDNENTKLGKWVANQRSNYRLQVEGKTSAMTTFRIQELESLGFKWDCSGPTWEDRLSELADYRKIHGHCNVPTSRSENTKLAKWVANQRTQYRYHQKGKRSQMTLPRIQELEILGFDWQPSVVQGKVTLKKPSLED